MTVEFFSECGRHRAANQDAIATWSSSENLRDGFVAVIADGVGSMLLGHEAASLAVETSLAFLKSNMKVFRNPSEVSSAICRALGASNQAIKELSLERVGDPYKSGACALCMVCHGQEITIGGVGDCAAFKVGEDGVSDYFVAEPSAGGSLVTNTLGAKGDQFPRLVQWTVPHKTRIGIATDGFLDYFPK
ncbi:MAG: protein phosphatase 2C domain-containing protein, partial [Pseudomonadota bacterium]